MQSIIVTKKILTEMRRFVILLTLFIALKNEGNVSTIHSMLCRDTILLNITRYAGKNVKRTTTRQGVIMNLEKTTEVEAAVFRRLLAHLDANKDVQNIDLMNLAGFCRNCLSKWYLAEAEQRDETIDYNQAQTVIYGIPFSEWKGKYQAEATAEQLARFNEKQK